MRILSLLALSLCFIAQNLAAAPIEWHNFPHIKIAVVSSVDADEDQLAKVGVIFSPDPGWHVYWKNAGDTGLPPKISLSPANSKLNVHFSELQWPFPHAIPFSHLVNYGYPSDTLVFANINSTTDTNLPTILDINANIEWLVCEESCIPGKASLNHTLNFAKNPESTPQDKKVESLFYEAQQKLPVPQSPLGSQIQLENGKIQLTLYASNVIFQHAMQIEVFPVATDIIAYSSPATLYWKKNLLRWEQELSEYFSTLPPELELVVVVDKTRSYSFKIPSPI